VPPAVVGGTISVGSKSKEQEDCRGIRAELGQAALVQQAGLKPAKASLRPPDKVRLGWRGARSVHFFSYDDFFLRALALLSIRSLASLSR
jgi:hypothetical protein